MNLSDYRLPVIKDPLFVDFVKDVLGIKLKELHLQKFGTNGQKQNGVDLLGRDQNGKWLGIQCKDRGDGKITEKKFLEEIEKAKKFDPPISTFIYATNTKRDVKIQMLAANQSNDALRVLIYSWEDLMDILNTEDKYKEVILRYYEPILNKKLGKNMPVGNTIGKVIDLTVGTKGRNYHSTYRVFIGKPTGIIGYSKNTYLIADLRTRRIEDFVPPHVFPSDIELVFDNAHDCTIITQWINSIDDIEKAVIQNEETKFKYLWTMDEYNNYCNKIREYEYEDEKDQEDHFVETEIEENELDYEIDEESYKMLEELLASINEAKK